MTITSHGRFARAASWRCPGPPLAHAPTHTAACGLIATSRFLKQQKTDVMLTRCGLASGQHLSLVKATRPENPVEYDVRCPRHTTELEGLGLAAAPITRCRSVPVATPAVARSKGASASQDSILHLKLDGKVPRPLFREPESLVGPDESLILAPTSRCSVTRLDTSTGVWSQPCRTLQLRKSQWLGTQRPGQRGGRSVTSWRLTFSLRR